MDAKKEQWQKYFAGLLPWEGDKAPLTRHLVYIRMRKGRELHPAAFANSAAIKPAPEERGERLAPRVPNFVEYHTRYKE